jgi:hypothetical protein
VDWDRPVRCFRFVDSEQLERWRAGKGFLASYSPSRGSRRYELEEWDALSPGKRERLARKASIRMTWSRDDSRTQRRLRRGRSAAVDCRGRRGPGECTDRLLLQRVAMGLGHQGGHFARAWSRLAMCRSRRRCAAASSATMHTRRDAVECVGLTAVAAPGTVRIRGRARLRRDRRSARPLASVGAPHGLQAAEVAGGLPDEDH